MLEKLKYILNAEQKAQAKKYTSLKKVLKALRLEKKRLEAELQVTSDVESKEEIASKLKIISVQRKKGLNLLKELKKERKAQKA
jgi:coenzyme F420-reducing hydrogenase delta subunit